MNDKTIIVYQRKNIKLSDLKIGESVVVIGDPNNKGQIQAELIRVVPTPPSSKGAPLPAVSNTPVNNTTATN